MRFIVLLFSLLIGQISIAQNKLLEESQKAQDKLNQEYLDPEKSILDSIDFETFTGLKFYPISEDFIVEAKFVRTPDEEPFLMPTSTERLPEYVKYAELHFKLNDEDYKLDAYQALDLIDDPEYGDYLFLPFTDETNGAGTYGGGRYMDLRIPDSEKIILDFNQAYNPYCAYNHKYSCPIPPPENDLSVRIEAGVKDFHEQ